MVKGRKIGVEMAVGELDDGSRGGERVSARYPLRVFAHALLGLSFSSRIISHEVGWVCGG